MRYPWLNTRITKPVQDAETEALTGAETIWLAMGMAVVTASLAGIIGILIVW